MNLTSLSADLASFFVEAEQVNMAKQDGFANVLPSLPLGIKVAGLSARGNAGAKIFVVLYKWGGGETEALSRQTFIDKGTWQMSKLCSLAA
jgi:hypothetical protein